MKSWRLAAPCWLLLLVLLFPPHFDTALSGSLPCFILLFIHSRHPLLGLTFHNMTWFLSDSSRKKPSPVAERLNSDDFGVTCSWKQNGNVVFIILTPRNKIVINFLQLQFICYDTEKIQRTGFSSAKYFSCHVSAFCQHSHLNKYLGQIICYEMVDLFKIGFKTSARGWWTLFLSRSLDIWFIIIIIIMSIIIIKQGHNLLQSKKNQTQGEDGLFSWTSWSSFCQLFLVVSRSSSLSLLFYRSYSRSSLNISSWRQEYYSIG